MPEDRMVATQFEYRHRFLMIALVYVLAYAFYNLDHLNVIYAVVPWSRGVVQADVLARIIYSVSAVVAAVGAFLLTWAKAYRAAEGDFFVAGPYRYVRCPQYLGYFLLLLALGSFQSRWGFPVMMVAEIILLLRLAGREEIELEEKYGERFREYRRRVPKLWPSVGSRVTDDGQIPRWRAAIVDQAFQWGFVVTLIAFACTLSDPVGYAFAYATLSFLVMQKLGQWVRVRMRNT
jgi:protein-S-isoprenylcysteine O-methyltransferase Ste14